MSIVEHARAELAAINFGEEDSRVMIEILQRFFRQWDSGGAVSVAAPILGRLLARKPLTPLTGEDREWTFYDEIDGGMLAQNLRCTTVFKPHEGPIFDIDSPGIAVTFPYMPNVTL